MKIALKRLSEQVVVLTGASSGIGLTTARMAAGRGARLMLAARSGESLQHLADEIVRIGGEAVHVVTDVTRPVDVRKITEVAIERFGGFDTGVNNAGTRHVRPNRRHIARRHAQALRRQLLGRRHGSLEAVKHLKSCGGALINIGSVESDVTVTLQGVYAASKHAASWRLQAS